MIEKARICSHAWIFKIFEIVSKLKMLVPHLLYHQVLKQGTYSSFYAPVRAFSTFGVFEWIYLSASLISLTVCLGVTIQRLTIVKPDKSDITFAIVLLIAILFCYHYVIHSMFTECWDELMVFVVSNIIVLIYCVINYFAKKDVSSQPVEKMVRLIVTCVLSPFLIIGGIFQSYRYYSSNNLLYNTVGPFTELQNACWMFLICVSLMKFHLQLQICMLILIIMSKGVAELTLEQKILLGSGVPVTILFIFVGYLGLRFENIRLMILFYFLSLLEPVYVTYKIITTHAQHDYNSDAIRDSTFACGCFALIIHILLVLSCLHFTKYYFGKGLKEKMFGDSATTQLSPENDMQYSTFIYEQ